MAGGRTDDRSQVEAPDECENHRSLKRERGVWGQRNGWTKGPEARQAAKPGGFGVLPNPSLALQASMTRKVSFPNGASSAGGPTKLKLEEGVAGHRSQVAEEKHLKM